MKCCKKSETSNAFNELKQGDTFLFNNKLCMKTWQQETFNGDRVIGVILETGELLYSSDFSDNDPWYETEVHEVNAECTY